MNRRIGIILLGFLFVLGSFAACSAGGEPEAEPEPNRPQVEFGDEIEEDGSILDEPIENADVLTEESTAGVDIVPGEYSILVNSNSSMFVIKNSMLIASESGLEASLEIEGTGLLYMCEGSKEEAESSAKKQEPVSVTDETETFCVPVSALDRELTYSVYSKKLGKWYERGLTFKSSSLPVDAFAGGGEKSLLPLEDGVYQIELEFFGGTGKASITSPVTLTVKDGEGVATVVWTSKKYDYMKVSGVRYDAISSEPGATFEIPIAALDTELSVIGDTTAMSTPHEIEYSIKLLSDTAQLVG